MSAEFREFNILIVDYKPYTVGLLRGILNAIGVSRISATMDTEEAVELLAVERFDAIFCDDRCKPDNPVIFAKAVRRESADRMIPLFLVSNGARRRHVELARDCGANDVIQRPFSINTVKAKLRSVTLKPKSFIQTEDFFGPDRRRNRQRGYAGEDRRTRKPKQIKIAARRKSSEDSPADPA